MFVTQGINATGIDQVIERAGVAKASLYNNFSGKSDLVAAYLDAQLAHFESLVTDLEESFESAERIHHLFDRVKRASEGRSFHGCPFSKASVELKAQSAGAKVIRRFYDRLERFFADALGEPRDDVRVRQLVVVYDGAMTNAMVMRDSAGVAAAIALAQKIAAS